VRHYHATLTLPKAHHSPSGTRKRLTSSSASSPVLIRDIKTSSPVPYPHQKQDHIGARAASSSELNKSTQTQVACESCHQATLACPPTHLRTHPPSSPENILPCLTDHKLGMQVQAQALSFSAPENAHDMSRQARLPSHQTTHQQQTSPHQAHLSAPNQAEAHLSAITRR